MTTLRSRVESFCERFGLQRPIMLAPMAGACPLSLSIAVMRAGGLGACGGLLMQPNEILAWADEVRREGKGPFQINLWIPDPPANRDPAHEQRLQEFLADWGPKPEDADSAVPPDFDGQCEALLAAQPPIVSSVMGLYPSAFVSRLKQHGIAWFANVSTVTEAQAAEAAGADVIVAQGAEAGGHRASFRAEDAEQKMVGLAALIPAIVDAVRIPVVATGGIADARGVAAALMLGASAVQMGSGYLRCPEANLAPAWAAALGRIAPEDTIVTRAFSGRAGRAVKTDYVLAATSPKAPPPAPYPVQRGLTSGMRAAALKSGDIERMQAWAGQSARLGRVEPAETLTRKIWAEAMALLRQGY